MNRLLICLAIPCFSLVLTQPTFSQWWAGSDVARFSEGYAPIYVGDKGGYINTKGRVVIKLQFSVCHNFSEGLAAVGFWRKDRYVWGYVNTKGALILKAKWEDALPFKEGLASVRDSTNLLYGFINKKGAYVIKPQFHDARSFSDGRALIHTGKIAYYIDRTGKAAFDFRADFRGDFHEGLASFRTKTGLRGFINKSGTVVIKPRYHTGPPPDQISTGPSATYFSQGLARVTDDWRGFIDKTGKLVISARFQVAGQFSDGLAYVSFRAKGNKVQGFIDRTGKLVFTLPPDADVGRFSEGLASYLSQKKCGYIDKTGKFSIVLGKVDRLDAFYGGFAAVWKKGARLVGYIDKKGKYIWKAEK